MNKSKRRDKVNKRKLRTTIIVVVIVAAVITAGVFVLRSRVSSEFGDESDLPETAQVTLGSISTTITGSGTLENEGSENVDIPETIETEEIVVKVGDKVEEGDLLATVNTASVISAMSDLQEDMEELDEQLEAAAEDTVSSRITAQVSGRVKEIYAAEGDDVASVMYENNALMLISLDGYMAVDVETDALKKGDSATVVLSDGTEYKGTVDQVKDGTATVLITDDGPKNGEKATVTSADGTSLGGGELYIHNPLKVTGYAGTVSDIHTEENKTVKQGTKLLTLTDTSYTANYDAILKERAELEEDMQRLITIYKEGAVYAPFAGTIESITDPDEEEEESDEELSAQITLCPSGTMSVSTGIDESEILSLELGQEATVTISSIGDTEFVGTVSEIETAGTSSGGVTKYTAIITLDKTDQMLAGMSASVAITTEGVENALLIPEDALNKTRNTAYVYTSYDEETKELGGMVEITYGISNGTYLQVLSGLSEGDTVYYYEEEDRMGGNMFSMGGMPDMGGMPNMNGGGMPSMGGGMPNMGGGMPGMGGGR